MNVREGLSVVRHLGLKWCWFRVGYWFRMRSGHFARNSPLGEWADVDLPKTAATSLRGLFNAEPAPSGIRGDWPAEADAIMAGQLQYFSDRHLWVGFPPDWHRNPIEERSWPRDEHWSRIGEWGNGDVKGVWEASRFAWTFPLACAWAETRDERYSEAYWTMFEGWMAANPPNRGIHWRCGQEAAFRLMGATFAISVLANSQATTPQRLDTFRRFVLQTGARILTNLDYAISQSNNHGMSECVGLITAAVLEPNSRDAARWMSVGSTRLQAQCDELIYADGGFSQHAINYLRVAIDDLIWTVHVLRFTGHAVPAAIEGGLQRALAFLLEMVDSGSGRAPCLGSNDGARILPVSRCSYGDFRPTLQLGRAILGSSVPFDDGPWNEPLAWFRLSPGPSAPRQPAKSWLAPVAGVAVLRKTDAWLMLRGMERYRHRPAQCDLLHVDLWWKGRNVLVDPGSFSYSATDRLKGKLKSAQCHNTVTVDDRDQLNKISRFLYAPWPRGEIGARNGSAWANHRAYADIGVVHSRRVDETATGWRVIDDLSSREAQLHEFRLHWLLADGPFRLQPGSAEIEVAYEMGTVRLHVTCEGVPLEADVVRAETDGPRGWISPYYLSLAPAVSFAVRVRGASTRLETRIELIDAA